MPRADAALQRGLDVLGDVDRDDGRDRRHHLAGLLLVEVEDPAEHAGLARIQVPALHRLADDELQLLGVLGLLGDGVGIDAQHVQDPVGDEGQRRDEGREEQPAEAQRTGDHAHQPVGVLDRVDLRHELADGDVRARDQQVGEDDRYDDGHPAEDRLEQVRNHGLAHGTDTDRGERDADLAGRDVLVDVVDLLEREGGAAEALLPRGLELRPPSADQRVLRDHEERVEQDQDEDRDEEQRGQARNTPGGAEIGPPPLLRGRSSSFIEATRRTVAGAPGGEQRTGSARGLRRRAGRATPTSLDRAGASDLISAAQAGGAGAWFGACASACEPAPGPAGSRARPRSRWGSRAGTAPVGRAGPGPRRG